MGVAEMVHFADMYSYKRPKCLYTFPTEKQMRDFVQSRLDPVLEKGYYSTLVNPDYNSLKQKRIRNSTLFFRTSSKPGAVEGIDVDYISLDEYDRVNPAAEASAEESMSSSKFGIRRRWSTPKLIGA